MLVQRAFSVACTLTEVSQMAQIILLESQLTFRPGTEDDSFSVHCHLTEEAPYKGYL